MDRNQLRIVLLVIAVAVGAVVVLLVTGGEGGGGGQAAVEQAGDVVVGAGEGAPSDTALADIEEADVTATGDQYVLTATFAAPVPKKLKGNVTFSFRWDVTGADGEGFIVSGNLDVGPNVSIVSTAGRYGASSLDKSFPGDMSIDGNTWTITIDATKLEDWPEDFSWKLQTSLDGVPGDPESALVEDFAPNEGFGSVTRA